MSIRRTNVDRVNEARKSSIPTIGRGEPNNSQGNEGDITFRRTSSGLKLYIKANQQWQGVKVGESFESLEEKINEVKDKVDLIKKLNLVTSLNDLSDVTFSSQALTISNMDTIISTRLTIDSEKQIILDAADTTNIGVNVAIHNDGAEVATWRAANNSNIFAIFEPGATSVDKFFIRVKERGETVIATIDADASDADIHLDADGDITIDSATSVINFKHNGTIVGNYINPFIASAIFG